jgi:hypothetical protein
MRYVKWFVRSAGAPVSETAANLCRSVFAFLSGTETPWVKEAREAAEAEAEGAEAVEDDAKAGSHASRRTTSSVRSAKALSAYKRQVVAIGVCATAICWAVFTWCACASPRACAQSAPAHPFTPRAPAGLSSPTAC